MGTNRVKMGMIALSVALVACAAQPSVAPATASARIPPLADDPQGYCETLLKAAASRDDKFVETVLASAARPETDPEKVRTGARTLSRVTRGLLEALLIDGAPQRWEYIQGVNRDGLGISLMAAGYPNNRTVYLYCVVRPASDAGAENKLSVGMAQYLDEARAKLRQHVLELQPQRTPEA